MSIKSLVFFTKFFYRNILNGRITAGKIKALLCNLVFALLRIPRVKYGPSAIWVEAANFCNLSCKGCWVPSLSKKLRPKTMGLNEYKKLIDEIKNTLIMLILQMSGESFLNANILDMLSYANERNIAVWISTNGSFPTSDDWGEKLVQTGIDTICFSVSGITQDEYAKYHHNGSIAYVTDNIKKIQTAKKRLRSKTPYLNLRMLVEHDKKIAKDKVKEFARKLGLGLDIRYLNTDYIFDGLDDPKKTKIRVSSDIVTKVKNSCPGLWVAPAVQSDGIVIPCCLNFFGLPLFGNIKERRFDEIWEGEEFNRFRHSILTDRKNVGGCAHCRRDALGFKEPFSRKKKEIYITFHE